MHKKKRWVILPVGEELKVEALSLEFNIPPTISNLLVQRGIDTSEKINSFFNPSLKKLHDPYLMQDMGLAVDRISKALERREKIMVYGDYDVDGMTSVSLVYIFLQRYTDSALFYIPDRYAEGYGISKKSIDYAKLNNVKLIITLDCGIKAINEVDYANSLGIDFIICDHHLPDDKLPQAIAVLDPKREDCNYPFKDLSGCGVGFKLIQAICMHREAVHNEKMPLDNIIPLLDLVVVSIAADVVPIIGENRVLAHYGLLQLNTNPNEGLKAIIQSANINQSIEIDDIIFKIAPRINAAGRMEIEIDHSSTKAQSGGLMAVKLLTATNPQTAMEYVNKIDASNQQRKDIDKNITQDAHDSIDARPSTHTKKCIVIYNPNWQKGVVGIVASRLIDTYYRPAVVLTKSNGFVSGSARSVHGFDLYQAVEHCADLLENFGGHTYATGLTLKEENLDKFKAKFEAYVEKHIKDEDLIPQINIDAIINTNEITPHFRESIKRLQPFGPKNPSPTFASYRMGISNQNHIKCVGANQQHLKIELKPEGSDYSTSTISAIAFSQTEHFNHIKNGGKIDVCFSIVENYYKGVVKAQMRIKDITPSC